MNFSGNGLKSAAAATALSLVLVACGGSEPASSSSEAPAATEAAAEETVNAVEEVAETTTDAVEETTEAVVEDTEAVVEEAAEDATDVVEAATDAVEEAAETAEEAVEDVTEAANDAVDAATNDRVSAEVVAQYAALTGDAGNGRRVFTQCMSCHAVQEGRNMAGPSLYGIIGRTSGTIEGFRYSDANANSGIVWTEETMFAYLERPQAFIPGTFMAFPGLPRPQDRADVIAYLKEQSN